MTPRGDDFKFQDTCPTKTRPSRRHRQRHGHFGARRRAASSSWVSAWADAAFFASAEHAEVSGAIGFYGRLSTREGEEGTAPKDRAARMRAPVLGLFGGADPGIPATDIADFERALKEAGVAHHIITYPGTPHSFFDRTFAEHKDPCEDAWRRTLGFIKTGEVTSRA